MSDKLLQRVSRAESLRGEGRGKERHLRYGQPPIQITLDFSVYYLMSSHEPYEVLTAHFIGKVA